MVGSVPAQTTDPAHMPPELVMEMHQNTIQNTDDLVFVIGINVIQHVETRSVGCSVLHSMLMLWHITQCICYFLHVGNHGHI